MLRVLLPIDDVDKIEHALQYVAQCQSANRWPIVVHILHVDPPLSRYVASRLPPGVTQRYHDDCCREVLAPAAAAFARANIPCRTHSVVGEPARCIVRFAREAAIDHIIMVTHARGAASDMLGGSVTAGVLRLSSVPVEIVPIQPRSLLRAYAGAAGAGAALLTFVYFALE